MSTESDTGYGDGYYPCYWGIAKNGQICELIADYFIIDEVLNVDEV